MSDETIGPVQESDKQATWWRAGRFVRAEEPEAFTRSWTSKINNWEKSLEDVGYMRIHSYGGESELLSIKVWWHRQQEHYLLDVSYNSDGISVFFVSAEDQPEFFATWYVGFIRDATVTNQGRHLETIAKTLTAFVRHGHGEETIDEYGESSLDDDRRRFEEFERERQEAKKK
jgi:hypothetical protein